MIFISTIDSPLRGPLARGPRWEFHAPRLGRRLSGVGLLRQDYFVRLECDPEVTSYLPWFPLKYERNGKPVECTADARVRYSDNHAELQFVCHASVGAHSETDADVTALEVVAKAHDCSLRYASEDSIRDNATYLANCHYILPWARDAHRPSEGETHTILGVILGAGNPVTLTEVSRRANLPIETTVAVVIRAHLRHNAYLVDIRARKFGRHSQVSSIPASENAQALA